MEPPQPPPPAPPSGGEKETSSGLDPGLACVLAYLFGWLGGLIIFLLESKNKFVRFNAMQSILLGVAFFVIWIALVFLNIVLPSPIDCFIAPVMPLVWLGYLILTIVLIVKSYGGQKVVLPIIGEMAEKQA
ncbi:MAG: DUF4870 domain-containing protein [Actinobacteria bacterium]|nr:MAG: DUF4870 domain-containing protein [Actinomycetota bacterium]